MAQASSILASGLPQRRTPKSMMKAVALSMDRPLGFSHRLSRTSSSAQQQPRDQTTTRASVRALGAPERSHSRRGSGRSPPSRCRCRPESARPSRSMQSRPATQRWEGRRISHSCLQNRPSLRRLNHQHALVNSCPLAQSVADRAAWVRTEGRAVQRLRPRIDRLALAPHVQHDKPALRHGRGKVAHVVHRLWRRNPRRPRRR